MEPTRTPVLLTMADFYGTLAAARALGGAGIPVTMAESRMLAPARWSRYVERRIACPVGDREHFMRFIRDFGQREPGHVLYATTDDTAYLFAKERDQLARHYRLLSPPLETIYTLLNKKRLAQVARELDIDLPETWFPEQDSELAQVGERARFPLLIKPQTQILFDSHMKGQRVDTAAELSAAYRGFARRFRYAPELLAYDPTVSMPMLQAYYPEASQGIYSVSGFIDPRGKRAAMRGAVKVLQRPRKLGIGLCFEDAPVVPALAEKLVALCREVGYYGVFEAEFIRAGDRALLIDFNPRYYSQMAFEIARGLPLPLLVHAAATGDEPRLDALLDQASAWRPRGKHVYTHRMILELMLRAQRLSGRLSLEEFRDWRSWIASYQFHATDAVLDRKDWAPSVVDVATHLAAALRNPRSFVRTMVLDR